MKTLEKPALNRILDPVGKILTPEIARELVNLKLDATTQKRIDSLADKCTAGELTPAEQSEYETYVSAIDFVGILQAKARAKLRKAP